MGGSSPDPTTAGRHLSRLARRPHIRRLDEIRPDKAQASDTLALDRTMRKDPGGSGCNWLHARGCTGNVRWAEGAVTGRVDPHDIGSCGLDRAASPEPVVGCVSLRGPSRYDLHAFLFWSTELILAGQGLTSLSIQTPHAFREPADLTSPFPFRLSHLALRFDDNQVSTPFLTRLFSALAPALTLRLCFSASTAFDSLTPTLPLIAPTVRHLILEDSRRTRIFEKLLSDFSSLESLEVCSPFPMQDHRWRLSESHFKSNLNTLPEPYTLRRLIIGTRKGDHLSRIAKQLRHKALTGLETIEFPRLARPAYTDEMSLQTLCQARSIKIVYSDSPAVAGSSARRGARWKPTRMGGLQYRA